MTSTFRHKSLLMQLLKALAAVVLIVLIVHGFCENAKKHAEKDENTPIWLHHKDFASHSFEQSQNQLKSITDMMVQVQSFHQGLKSNQDSTMYEVRGFYLSIFAGLFSAFYLGNTQESRKKKWMLLCSLVSLMYLLDINFTDGSEELSKYIDCDAKTVRTLTKIVPDSTLWYYIDFDSASLPQTSGKPDSTVAFSDNHVRASKFEVRAPRKFQEALSPKFEQSCYYLLPLLLLIFSEWNNENRKRKL